MVYAYGSASLSEKCKENVFSEPECTLERTSFNTSIPYGKVISMADIRDLKILQHNRLIEGAAKMDTVTLKLFEIAVASIDLSLALNGNDNEIIENRTVTFSKELVFNIMDSKDSDKYFRMKNQLNKLREKAGFEVVIPEENNSEIFEVLAVNAISQTRWSSKDKFITLVFTPEIMPYLIDLKKNGLYTQYKLEDIAKMESKYSIVLFKWLVMNYNQYTYYKNKKNRTINQKTFYKNPSIKMDELRRITDTTNEYSRFYDFERNVLKSSLKEINEFTNLKVSYEKLKSGKYIDEIQFYIEEKPKKFIAPITDDEILKTSEQKEYEELSSAESARKSKYIDSLIKNGILTIQDVLSTKRMARVQNDLIENLTKIEKIKGFEGVNDHLNLVHKAILNSDNPIIDKLGYQIKSTKNYLIKLGY